MNMMQAFQMVQQLQGNPQMILQRFGLPQNLNSPQEVVKYLIDNGKVTQAQLDQFNNMYNSFRK